MSVSNSFQKLLTRIQPLDSEIQAAYNHIETIKTRLKSVFTIKKFLITGSASRGTFIRGKSDIDLFIVVSRDDLRWGDKYISSMTALDNFRKELEARFRNTPIYKDLQAVVVDFLNCRIDVVPAFFYGTTENNWPLYSMPDGVGGWMHTSPELHNKYILNADKESGGKLKYTAQLMKFWRDSRSPRVPLSSFYIEMILASQGICKGVKSYALCMQELFQNIAARECRPMRDPLEIAGSIACVKTETQKAITLSSVRYSRDHSKSAVSAEPFYTLEAKRQWDIVFNQKFPW